MPAMASLDKVIKGYIGSVAKRSFTFRGETVRAKPLTVSPLLFRGYTCPENCGGCCFKFDLLYLPSENHPYALSPITFNLNGISRVLYVDLQKNNPSFKCRNLNMQNGRCNIHGRHPFSCDFELIRFIHQEERNFVRTQLFGRGWNMLRVDGQRGALCEIIPLTDEIHGEIHRKLNRLKEWADYFKIDTHMRTILDWVESGPHGVPLRLEPDDD